MRIFLLFVFFIILLLARPVVVSDVMADAGIKEVPDFNWGAAFVSAVGAGITGAGGSGVLAEVSAYTADPVETDSSPEIMASGARVRDGVVANNCLKFGQRVEIGGVVYEVQDRMNVKYGCDSFDIFMWDRNEALEFGRQKILITILN